MWWNEEITVIDKNGFVQAMNIYARPRLFTESDLVASLLTPNSVYRPPEDIFTHFHSFIWFQQSQLNRRCSGKRIICSLKPFGDIFGREKVNIGNIRTYRELAHEPEMRTFKSVRSAGPLDWANYRQKDILLYAVRIGIETRCAPHHSACLRLAIYHHLEWIMRFMCIQLQLNN